MNVDDCRVSGMLHATSVPQTVAFWLADALSSSRIPGSPGASSHRGTSRLLPSIKRSDAVETREQSTVRDRQLTRRGFLGGIAAAAAAATAILAACGGSKAT